MKIVKSNDPDVQNLDHPAPVICAYCGKPLYTSGIRLIGDHIVWMPAPERCDCPSAVAEYEKSEAERLSAEELVKKAEAARAFQQRIKKIVGESGMGRRFLSKTFDSFELTMHNRAAVTAVRRYADNFERHYPKKSMSQELGRNGLFISGPTGTGKTHLVAAIANQLMAEGTPVICMTMIDLLERIKRTYRQEGVDEGEVLSVYKTVPLLIIDDMGKEPPTEWAISTIYNIINGRYEDCMPIIITTNYTDKDLISRMTPRNTGDSVTAEATIDRLMEMCMGIVLKGSSWRQK